MNNLPARSEKRIIVPVRRELAVVNVRPKRHVRKYSDGHVTVVNPQIIPRHQVIVQSRRDIKPTSGFESVIQLRPKVRGISSADALWERLRNDETTGPFVEYINNNISLVKNELYHEFTDSLRKMSEEDAVDDIKDYIETWEDRWGGDDQVFFKFFGDWKKYPDLEFVSDSFDDDPWDEVWKLEFDPFDGKVLSPDKGWNISVNEKNFAQFDMLTHYAATDILDEKNVADYKKYYSKDDYGKFYSNILFDHSLLKRLVKDDIPFLHGIIGVNNVFEGMLLVPRGEESRVQKIYDELMRKK